MKTSRSVIQPAAQTFLSVAAGVKNTLPALHSVAAAAVIVLWAWPLITCAQSPPSITSQPISQSLNAGNSATFTVGVAGTIPLVFQWQKDGTKLVDTGNLSGSTTSHLSLSNVTGAD